MPTKIVFANGVELTVEEDAQDALERLNSTRGKAALLTRTGSAAKVFVSPTQIAYLENVESSQSKLKSAGI